MENYTVKDISELVGCSGQSVRNAAKTLGIKPKRDSKGRFVFSESEKSQLIEHVPHRVPMPKPELEEKPKEDVKPKEEPTTSEQALNNISAELIAILREQLKEKDAQLREKDTQLKEKDAQMEKLLSSLERSNEQIASLLETNKALSAANAVQIAADKKDKLIEQAVTEPAPAVEEKRGFFARLFGR